MSLNVTKRNATTQPIAGTSYVNEVLDAVNGKPNGVTGVGGDQSGCVDNIPIRIESASGNGIYSITIGSWKNEIPESGSISIDDIFDFDTDGIVAMGIAIVEIIAADGVHNFAAGALTLGSLQAGRSDGGKAVVSLDSRGIIDLRYSASTHSIEVTFDGSTWIPKVVFAACSADVTVTT